MDFGSVGGNDTEPQCSLFPEEKWKCDTIIIVRRTVASISLIICGLMIFLIWLFRKYQFFIQRLVLYLSVAAALADIGYLYGGLYRDGTLCNFEGFWLTFSEWSVLLWVCSITFSIFRRICEHKLEGRQWELGFSILCWIFPLAIAAIPYALDLYGPAGPWCWIEKKYSKWRFIIWYFPLIFVILALCLSFVVFSFLMKRRQSRWDGTHPLELDRLKILKEDIKILRAYPLIYLFTSFFPLLNRINNAFYPDDPNYVFYIIHCCFVPLTGALNALAFGMDRDIKSKMTYVQIKANFLSHFDRQTRTRIRDYSVEEDRELNGFQYSSANL